MTPGDDSTHGLFDWSRPQWLRWSLFGFLAFAVAIHALSFYFFQVVYPPTVSLRPPSVEVSLTELKEGDPLALWAAAEDPSLVRSMSLSRSDVAESLLALPYEPSYATAAARTMKAPEPDQPDALPLAVPLAPVSTTEFQPKSHAPPAIPASSRLRISTNGAIQILPLPKSLNIPANATSPLREMVVLLRTSKGGRVENAFVLESSGARPVDQAVLRGLVRLPAPAGETPPTGWHKVHFLWGGEVYRKDAAMDTQP